MAINPDKVWERGARVFHNDPDIFRKDACGAWIRRSDYGRNTEYGWEVDHVVPKAAGGSDDADNLAPLHWENNIAKSDGPPSCPVTSNGSRNVRVG